MPRRNNRPETSDHSKETSTADTISGNDNILQNHRQYVSPAELTRGSPERQTQKPERRARKEPKDNATLANERKERAEKLTQTLQENHGIEIGTMKVGKGGYSSSHAKSDDDILDEALEIDPQLNVNQVIEDSGITLSQKSKYKAGYLDYRTYRAYRAE